MDVLKEQVKYYSILFCQSTQIEGSMKEVVGAFMNEEQFPKLHKGESLQCEGMTSEDETGLALCSMKNGSSPGRDGLTIEFTKILLESSKNYHNELL